MTDSAGDIICELRCISNYEDCNFGTAGRLRVAGICCAADVNNECSRILAGANNRSEWRGVKRTVASKCGYSWLGVLSASASSFRLSYLLPDVVDNAMMSTTK